MVEVSGSFVGCSWFEYMVGEIRCVAGRYAERQREYDLTVAVDAFMLQADE